MICVLLAAAGADWESAALGLLAAERDVTVLKRCVDIDDLLASAAAGQADAAVVALDAPGLDASAVDHLRRHQVRPIAITSGSPADSDGMRAARLGITTILGGHDLAALAPSLAAGETDPGALLDADGLAEEVVEGEPPEMAGRVVAVWGPQGAPGRTTIAVGIAAALAARPERTLLVDADPYGGAVAQQLGVLDEVSGLLSAARLTVTGSLADRFATVPRSLAPGLSLVTGLPRADRWTEVRPGVIELLLETAGRRGHVVTDTGFSLEADPSAELAGRPNRNGLTLGALSVADEIVVVGTPDPVGLSRLARGLAELRETVGPRPFWVVVNRQRNTLGWSEREVVGMIEGFAQISGVHFLPDDRAAVDRALVAGRTLVESGDSALSQSLVALADAVVPALQPSVLPGRIRRRTAARARRR